MTKKRELENRKPQREEKAEPQREEKAESKSNLNHVILFAVSLSGGMTLIIFFISLVTWLFVRDPLLILTHNHIPTEASVKMLCYILVILFFSIYVPFKLGVQEKTISKKSGIVMVTLLTYLLSSVSLGVFLSLTTELVDYENLSEKNNYTEILLENGVPCTFNLKESFFDAVSGFTTTGLTAFRRTGEYRDKREISKIDAQPMLIHIIRATYLWVGGLGIMFFYLYFTPIPSMMISMGYEIPIERSLPRFIRLESLSFSLVYVVVTALGILLLFFSISSSCQNYTNDTESVISYSIILAFSSISTGGFSPGSASIDQLEIEGCRIINEWGLLILMFLMLAGAMPLFSLHRPLKFFRRWVLFVVFLSPIVAYGVLSYSEGPGVSLSRSFDAVSAFTTTGLYTSQFEEDTRMPSETERRLEYKKTEYVFEYEMGKYVSKYEMTEYTSENRRTEYKIGDEIKIVKKIYEYRFRNIFLMMLMFIGGASYSTAGGWGFFNFFCIISGFFLVLRGKLERALAKYILGLLLYLTIFFLIFAIGTTICYYSGLFGTLSGPEPAAVADYVINSAFYEISALSTVGLMPDSMLQDEGIYYHDLAYWTLAVSMLIGRLYYIVFPFFVSLFAPEEGI
ncbi:MAG: hypothetical protein HXS54_04265 [Theionarchaea archaeon]|nr:hypothetical protein [Theionarchaea archaeon]